MQIHSEHNDTMIKTSDTILLEKYTSHFIRKGCMWEGVRDRVILSAKLAHANGIYTSAVFGMACLVGSEVNIQHLDIFVVWCTTSVPLLPGSPYNKRADSITILA